MAKASRVLAAQRVDELLRIRLDGAEHHDVVSFIREKEQEEGSLWYVADDKPLSVAMIRKYQERADGLIYATHDKSRKRNFRRHVAQLRHLYARAATTGELSVARAVLRDLAEMLNLYPPARVQHSGPGGGPIPSKVSHDFNGQLQAYAPAVRAFLASLEGTDGPGALPPDSARKPLDQEQAPSQTGPLPPA